MTRLWCMKKQRMNIKNWPENPKMPDILNDKNYLASSTERISLWKANKSTPSPEISYNLCNPEVCYRVYNNPVLSQINPVLPLTFYFEFTFPYFSHNRDYVFKKGLFLLIHIENQYTFIFSPRVLYGPTNWSSSISPPQ